MTINSRDKGKRFEREAAKLLNRLIGGAWRRMQQHAGSPDAPDIKSDLYPALIVEVKAVEKLNLRDAMKQAEGYCDPQKHIPVVLHKKKNKDWLVTIKAEDLPRFASHVDTGIEIALYEDDPGLGYDIQQAEKYGNE